MNENPAPSGKLGGINAFTLKLIAILGMTFQHCAIVFGAYLPPGVEAAMYIPGGFTFPIMAYFLAEGYRHTRDVKKYALRLLLFALLAYYPFYLLFSMGFNVLFTLLAGLLVLYTYDHMKRRALFWLLFIALVIVTSLYCDWGGTGVVMVYLSYKMIPQSKAKRIVLPLILPWASALDMLLRIPDFAYVLPWLLFYLIGCTATIPLLLHYNGQKGPSMKYLFYTYYPTHLLVLAAVRAMFFL